LIGLVISVFIVKGTQYKAQHHHTVGSADHSILVEEKISKRDCTADYSGEWRFEDKKPHSGNSKNKIYSLEADFERKAQFGKRHKG
jgi:hypothetical protein